MVSPPTRPGRLLGSVAGRLTRLRLAIADAGEQLRERIAAIVGTEVARAVGGAVRRALDLTDFPAPRHDPDGAYGPYERDQFTDDPDPWYPPEPVRRPWWRRALAALGRLAAAWFATGGQVWSAIAAVVTGLALALSSAELD